MKFATLFLTTGLLFLASCASAPPPGAIQEVNVEEIAGCTQLGDVVGSNSVFIGLSASVGRQEAKKVALNQAIQLGGNRVVWSEFGTSMTNEWAGKAYKC